MVLYDIGAGLVRWIFDRRIAGPPILDAEAFFPDGTKFAAAWPDIRREAERVAQQFARIPRFHELMPEQADISANDGRDWRLFVLKAYGIANAENMAACPALARIVAASPDVLSASFSFLEQGKHVPAHRGPFRGVLRFYMGLSIPTFSDGRPAAILKIAGEEHPVRDGEWLLWDDTYLHETWNRGEAIRCVLLLDVRRRHMPIDMRLLANAIIWAVARAVRRRGFDPAPAG